MTPIKEPDGVLDGRPVCIMFYWGWRTGEGGDRSRGGRGWRGVRSYRQTAQRNLTALPRFMSAPVISIRAGKKVSRERFGRVEEVRMGARGGFPRCSASYTLPECACITMTTGASGRPGIHSYLEETENILHHLHFAHSSAHGCRLTWFTQTCWITDHVGPGRLRFLLVHEIRSC